MLRPELLHCLRTRRLFSEHVLYEFQKRKFDNVEKADIGKRKVRAADEDSAVNVRVFK